MLQPTDFFDLNDSMALEIFAGVDQVWQVLPRIKEHISRIVGEGQTILGQVSSDAYVSERPIFIGRGARIEPGAYILGPAYIGEGAVVRHGAYLRENVILLPGSVLGHASEAKNSLFLPGALAPHFNYVGDSILGSRVNLGAGTRLSNLGMLSPKDRITGRRPSIVVSIDGRPHDTGLSKLGAILGDDAQTGCNAVLNPGCLVGRRTIIYANLSLAKGYYASDRIIKLRQVIEQSPREERSP